MIGQAALGFVLPWLLAMVAIPLEMLLDSGRHVVAACGRAAAAGARQRVVRMIGGALISIDAALPAIYDVYVAIPLRIERLVRGSERSLGSGTAPGPRARWRPRRG